MLTACGTTRPDPVLIPIRAELTQPCERVALPQENELPALAEGEAGEAQLNERRFWGGYVVVMNGALRRLCRQRDEAVQLGINHNQLVTGADSP